jgi:beta-phosphoglucomutase-like phosphatase (HAD superfamily)
MSYFIRKPNLNAFSKYKTVIFDLSGVLVDFGVRIPYTAMYTALFMNNIIVHTRLIEHGMGRNEIKHIKTLCKLNNKTNSQKIYNKVIKDYNSLLVNLNNNPYYNYPIKGSIELTHKFKNMGYNIGIITSYDSNISNLVFNKMQTWGFKYDYTVNNCNVSNSRPNPDMIFNVMDYFNTKPEETLKIGESYLNLFEGSSLNIDTINIIDTSRDMGLEEIEYDDLCEEVKKMRRLNIIHHLSKYPQPKYTVDTVQTINELLI